MDIWVVETFQYDWRDKKVTSQYMLVETCESAEKIVDNAVKEYEGTKVELVLNDEEHYVYRISVSEVEGVGHDMEFFIGGFRRHVHSDMDVKELLGIITKKEG